MRIEVRLQPIVISNIMFGKRCFQFYAKLRYSRTESNMQNFARVKIIQQRRQIIRIW